MGDEGKGHAPKGNSREPARKTKDCWDKADVIFKFLATALIVLFGFFGNQLLQEKQDKDNSIKLYTQLLSNKEASENTLRKDMFNDILHSFLQTKKDEDKDSLTRIQEMRLSLELLARNFHESLDMKPLFNHLLMELIRPRRKLKHFARDLEKCLEAKGGEQKKNYDHAKYESQEIKEIIENDRMEIKEAEFSKNEIIKKKKMLDRMLKYYDRERDSLIKIAQRVTRKQREVLEDVAGKLSLTITLKGDEKDDICTAYSPLAWLPKEESTCISQKNSDEKNEDYVISGVSTPGTLLTFKDAEGNDDEASSRYFLMSVRYIYPRWKQVYVEILTCPVGKDERMTEGECRKSAYKETGRFWLEYFDFPLIDNTYINSMQRYSVILEGFEADKDGEDEKAKITLLYYPASYAGLKEKSFYNNKMMRSLLKSNLFSEVDSVKR